MEFNLAFARIVSDKVTGGASFSVSTTDHRYTVPAGKRWYPISYSADFDVSSTLTVRLFDSDDLQISTIGNHSASTNPMGGPDYQDSSNSQRSLTGMYPLITGDYVKFDIGTAQTGAAILLLRAFEVSV